MSNESKKPIENSEPSAAAEAIESTEAVELAETGETTEPEASSSNETKKSKGSRNRKKGGKGKKAEKKRSEKLEKVIDFVLRHKAAVIGFTTIFIAVAAYGIYAFFVQIQENKERLKQEAEVNRNQSETLKNTLEKYEKSDNERLVPFPDPPTVLGWSKNKVERPAIQKSLLVYNYKNDIGGVTFFQSKKFAPEMELDVDSEIIQYEIGVSHRNFKRMVNRRRLREYEQVGVEIVKLGDSNTHAVRASFLLTSKETELTVQVFMWVHQNRLMKIVFTPNPKTQSNELRPFENLLTTFGKACDTDKAK